MATQKLEIKTPSYRAIGTVQQEIEDRFRILLDYTPTAIAMLDRNLDYLLVSQRWLMDFALRDQNIIGRSFYEVFPLFQGSGNPKSTLERWQQSCQRCLAGAWEKCEAEQFRRPDGSTDWVSWEMRPWLTSTGEIGGLILSTEIITERKQSEEALRKSQQILQLVMDNLPQAIFWKNKNLVYQGCNQKFAVDSGVASPQEIVGKTDYDLTWTHQEADCCREFDSQLIKTNTPRYDIITCQRLGDGTPAWLEINKIPLHDADGHVVGILGTYEDITERKRREAERLRLLNVVERSLNEIYTFDAETLRFQYVNAGARRNLNYSLEAMRTMTPLDILPELDEESFHQLINPLLQHEREKLEFPTLHRRADGSMYPVEVHLQLIEHDGESLFLAVVLDISERRRAEASLRKSEARYRAIIEDQTELICRFFPDGTLTFVNGAYCRYFGKTKAQLIGYSFLPVIPEEDQKRVNQHLASLSLNNTVVTCEHRVIMPNGEIRWQQWTHRAMFDEQGNLVQFQAVGRDISKLKRAEEALKEANEELEIRVEERTTKLRKAIERLKDEIGERKQAEEARSAQKQLLQNVIDTNPCLMYVKDWDGKFVLVNRACASAYGTSVKELIGKTEADFHPNLEEVQQSLQADREIMETLQEKFVPEEAITLPNGEVRWMQTIKKPFLSAEGTTCQVLGVATDITERKQAEEALRQTSAALHQKANQLEQALHELRQTQAQLVQTEKMSSLGQLVAGVAHEINNPVNFIYGNLIHASEYTQDLLHLLQLYQQYYPHPVCEIQEEIETIDLDFLMSDLPKMLSSMKVGADRIRQIVLSLRNFSRLDESQMKAVNIHEGMDSTLLILQNRTKAQADFPGIQIIKEYGDLPSVYCYAGQLNQVFMNLISNAIDALESLVKQPWLVASGKTTDNRQLTAEPPTIWIRTSLGAKGKSVVIRIADNGPGITEEVRQRLFDPFFTTKPVGKGTGLGLSISYQIVVEKHRGKLQCLSTPGQGAEFVIEIPIQPQASAEG